MYTLFKGITLNNINNGDFYCLNCIYSFRSKTKFELHENVCKNNGYC